MIQLSPEQIENLALRPLRPDELEDMEYYQLIANQESKDRLFRDSVIQISREIYLNMIRDAGPRITEADMGRIATTCIDAARVYVEQVRDNL